MKTRSLEDIFARYGTDKGPYAPAYRAFLESRRDAVTTVIEVGIGTMIPGVQSSMVGYGMPHYAPGASLRSWRDYFPRASVFGLDVQPDTQFTDERIRTFLCDSTSADAVAALLDGQAIPPADLVIDDGSHRPGHQLATLRHLFPHVKPGGLYVIEDVAGNGIHARLEEIAAVTGSPVFLASPDSNPIFIPKPAAMA